MKHLKLLSIVCALVILFTVPLNVSAAETTALPDPGITPDSPFYFVDKWSKQISMMFTFNAEGKVQKALQYAEERLAEMEAMAEQKRVQDMERAANEYQNCLTVATRNMEQTMENGIDTAGQVTTMMANHISFMNNEQNTGTESLLRIRAQVREMAETCQETTIRTIAAKDPEKALALNLALMEQECERISTRFDQGDTNSVNNGLQHYERLQTMNQEIIAAAAQMGKISEAQQMVEKAMANQLQVLNRVCEEIQIGHQDSVTTLLQNQVTEQERTKLDNGSGGPPVSAETGMTGNVNGTNQTGGSGDSSGGSNINDSGTDTGSTSGSITGGNQSESSGSGKK